jgi:hypothetical protein
VSGDELSLWKKIAIRSLFGAVGVAIALAAIVGVAMWWHSRPKLPKPWNTGAIKATYDGMDVNSDQRIEFIYVLENTTDMDYQLDSDAEVQFMIRLREPKSLDPDNLSELIRFPISIPAKERILFRFDATFLYYRNYWPPRDASLDERTQAAKKLDEYVRSQTGNLDGFVLFDANKRYQVNFPRAW